MAGYPSILTPAGHVEPVPRRIRGYVDGRAVIDTIGAQYGWEAPNYPQYHLPVADVADGLLVDEGREHATALGTARLHGVRRSQDVLPAAALVYGANARHGLADTVRLAWGALDAWFEEDEQVFVHPRDPYTRVDALRSGRLVRVELDGIVLAESASPVMVVETGLPTRYYLPRPDVDLSVLVPSDTVSACPYKGTTSAYWSLRSASGLVTDLAWCYDFPTRQLLPIAGLVAFYNERVDVSLDGVRQQRPVTHFG